MASVTVGPCGSSPQVWWDISWTPGNTTWTVTARRGSDATFTGGGWTVALLLDNGTTGSTYVYAPVGGNTSSSGTITMSPLPSSANYIYLSVTSTNFSSSGLFYGNTNGVYNPPVYYVVTVEDRVGNSSGTLLGSGTYSVLGGTSVSASSLRSNTYTGYNYNSCTSATINSATTLYRYFTATGWNVTDTGTYSNVCVEMSRSVNLSSYGVSRIEMTFALPGTAVFTTSSSLDTIGFLSLSTDFNSATGNPSSILTEDDDSGGGLQYKLSYSVQAGITYYLYTRFVGTGDSGSITISVDAPGWTITDMDSVSGMSSRYERSVTLGSYEISRVGVSFSKAGSVKFYTEGQLDTVGYLSETSELNSATGAPAVALASNDDSNGSTQYSISYQVEEGKTYYLWTRFYGYGTSGSTKIIIVPSGSAGLRICIRKNNSTEYARAAVWIYKDDGGGPNNNGWHRASPMVYCNANGEERFHVCG